MKKNEKKVTQLTFWKYLREKFMSKFKHVLFYKKMKEKKEEFF